MYAQPAGPISWSSSRWARLGHDLLPAPSSSALCSLLTLPISDLLQETQATLAARSTGTGAATAANFAATFPTTRTTLRGPGGQAVEVSLTTSILGGPGGMPPNFDPFGGLGPLAPGTQAFVMSMPVGGAGGLGGWVKDFHRRASRLHTSSCHAATQTLRANACPIHALANHPCTLHIARFTARVCSPVHTARLPLQPSDYESHPRAFNTCAPPCTLIMHLVGVHLDAPPILQACRGSRCFHACHALCTLNLCRLFLVGHDAGFGEIFAPVHVVKTPTHTAITCRLLGGLDTGFGDNLDRLLTQVNPPHAAALSGREGDQPV